MRPTLWAGWAALVLALLVALAGTTHLDLSLDLFHGFGNADPTVVLVHPTDQPPVDLTGHPWVAAQYTPSEAHGELGGLATRLGRGDYAVTLVFLADKPAGFVHTLREAVPSGWAVGVPVIEDAFEQATAEDQRVLLPAALLVLGLVLLGTTRRLWGTAVPLAATAISALVVAGIMGWSGRAVGGPMMVLVPLVLILGLSDSVHLMWRYAEERRRHDPAPLTTALRQVAPTCLLTTVTTSMAFAALALAQAPSLREFGFFGALGLGIAWCTALGVPTLMLASRAPTHNLPPPPEWLAGLPRRLAALTARHPRRTATLLAGSAVVLTVASLQYTVDDFTMTGELGPGRAAADHRAADEVIGGLYPLGLVVTPATGTRKPEAFADLLQLHREVLNREEVGGVLSFADAVRMTGRVAGLTPDQLTGGGIAHPGTTRRRYEAVYDRARAGAALASPLPLVDVDDQRFYMQARVRDVGARRLTELLDALHALDERALRDSTVTFGGPVAAAVDCYRAVVSDLVRILLATAVGGALMLAVWFRSIRVGLLYVPAIVLTISATLAAMAAFGIAVAYANLFVLTTGLGVGIDAQIHLVRRYREEYIAGTPEPWDVTLRTTGWAVISSHGLLLCGLAVLLASGFHTIRSAAALLMLALTVNFVSTVCVCTLGRPWLLPRRGAG